MSVTILKKSLNLIEIKKGYLVNKIIGLFFISIPIIVFISITLLEPKRFGKTIADKVFCIILILLFLFILIRENYFMSIDKNRKILKIEGSVEINGKLFSILDFFSIYIIEYNGIGIMTNGFNVFLKLKSGKRIPVSIRVDREDMEKVKIELQHFLGIEKIEKKRWWIG